MERQKNASSHQEWDILVPRGCWLNSEQVHCMGCYHPSTGCVILFFVRSKKSMQKKNRLAGALTFDFRNVCAEVGRECAADSHHAHQAGAADILVDLKVRCVVAYRTGYEFTNSP